MLLASVAFAAAATKPGYVLATVNLRAAPSRGAEILTKIPGGTLIQFGGCSEGWCEVIWKEKTGYAIQTALDLSGHIPTYIGAVGGAAAGLSAQGLCGRRADLLRPTAAGRVLRRTLLAAPLLASWVVVSEMR